MRLPTFKPNDIDYARLMREWELLDDRNKVLERENATLRADLLIEEERSIYWRDNEGKAMAENAALRAALDSLRTKIADAAKGDCRKLHDFERIALAMKEAQP